MDSYTFRRRTNKVLKKIRRDSKNRDGYKNTESILKDNVLPVLQTSDGEIAVLVELEKVANSIVHVIMLNCLSEAEPLALKGGYPKILLIKEKDSSISILKYAPATTRKVTPTFKETAPTFWMLASKLRNSGSFLSNAEIVEIKVLSDGSFEALLGYPEEAISNVEETVEKNIEDAQRELVQGALLGCFGF